MPEVDAYFYGPAKRFYENVATADQQAEIDRIIRNIFDNPGIDNQVKFFFPVPPAIFSLYASNGYWIVYHQRGNLTLGVLNIGCGKPSAARYGSEPDA